MRRITLLLCSAVFFLTLPVDAKDKRPGSKHRTHHYSPRYNSHARGHSSQHPAYSSHYHGRSSHRHSNYGRSNHSSSYSSILNQLLRRL